MHPGDQFFLVILTNQFLQCVRGIFDSGPLGTLHA